ncbi:MAG: hypothetical protein CM15mP112_00070 [Flavobacteriales bacterium]|nr:MAG: hypothetical protein CM15mP112_00070 [Flavobacteriales bacterium]
MGRIWMYWSKYSERTYSRYLEGDVSILDTSERTIRRDTLANNQRQIRLHINMP